MYQSIQIKTRINYLQYGWYGNIQSLLIHPGPPLFIISDEKKNISGKLVFKPYLISVRTAMTSAKYPKKFEQIVLTKIIQNKLQIKKTNNTYKQSKKNKKWIANILLCLVTPIKKMIKHEQTFHKYDKYWFQITCILYMRKCITKLI